MNDKCDIETGLSDIRASEGYAPDTFVDIPLTSVAKLNCVRDEDTLRTSAYTPIAENIKPTQCDKCIIC